MATIKGKITDAETGNPIPDAAVVSGGSGDFTKSDGSYSLSVALGTYDVLVSKEGYEKGTESASATEEKEYTIDISLTASEPVGPEPSRVVVGVKWDTDTFDPHFASTTPSMYYRWQIFEALTVERGFDYLAKPWLAYDWETPTNTSYVFHLRRDVKFHDGSPFNATAVKYSLDRIMDPTVGATISGEFVGVVESVEIIDEHTVEINITRPISDFLITLGRAPIMSPTAVEKWGDDISSHPVGTGPYKFVEWVPGSHTLFEANDQYWGGTPNIDEVQFRVIPEDSVRLVELKTGGIHLTQLDLYEEIAELKADPDFIVGIPPAFSPRFIAFNFSHTPLDDVRVRKAVAYAINPQEVVDHLFFGFGYPCLGPTAFGTWYNPNLPYYYHDQTKALELLEQAGYEDGFTFTLLVGQYARWEDEAVIYQAQLAQVGITMEIEVLEFSAALERLINGQFEAYYFGGGDPDSHLRWFWHSTANYNYNNINNTKIDELILMLQATEDVGERKRLFDEVALEIYDSCYYAYTYAGLTSANVWTSELSGYYGDTFYYPYFTNAALGVNAKLD